MERESYRELFSLFGRTAIVTGACGIIGQRLCHGLADFGANVAVVDLDHAKCDALAAELSHKTNGEAAGFACDVSDPGAVSELVAAVERRLGRIQVLANNAATKSRDLVRFLKPAEDYELSMWREVSSVNLDGAFLVAQAVGRHMISHGQGGSIIQTSSIYGVVAPDDRIYEGSNYQGHPISTPPVYAASKAGLIGLTRYLAARWAKSGIRVNTLVPGGVESGQNDVFIARYSARVPMARMAKAEDMVGALIFLASDASAYMTGQTIAVDGGLTAW